MKANPEILVEVNEIMEGQNAKYINSLTVVQMQEGPTFAKVEKRQGMQRCHASYRIYKTTGELRPDQPPLKIAHQRKSDVTLLGEKKESGAYVKL